MLQFIKISRLILAMILCILSVNKFVYASPNDVNGLTFDTVGEGGTMDRSDRHLTYIPIKIKSAAQVREEDITIGNPNINPSNLRPYVQLCKSDHCGFTALGERDHLTSCFTPQGGIVSLQAGEECEIWLQAHADKSELPILRSGTADITVTAKQCKVNPSISDQPCPSGSITPVTYHVTLHFNMENTLYTGGSGGLYGYTGRGWNQLVVVNNSILGLAVFQGDLYFGGSYTTAQAGADVGRKYLNRYAATILPTDGIPYLDGTVRALAVYGDDSSLEIGGEFTNYYGYLSKDVKYNSYPLPGIASPLKAIDASASGGGSSRYGEVVVDGTGGGAAFDLSTSSWSGLPVGSRNLTSNTIKYFDDAYGYYCTDSYDPNPYEKNNIGIYCYKANKSGKPALVSFDTLKAGEASKYPGGIRAIDFNKNLDKVFLGGAFNMDGISNIIYSSGSIQDFITGGGYNHSPNYGVDGPVLALLSVGKHEWVGGFFRYLYDNNSHQKIQFNGLTCFTIQDGQDKLGCDNMIPPFADDQAINSLVMAPTFTRVKLDK